MFHARDSQSNSPHQKKPLTKDQRRTIIVWLLVALGFLLAFSYNYFDLMVSPQERKECAAMNGQLAKAKVEFYSEKHGNNRFIGEYRYCEGSHSQHLVVYNREVFTVEDSPKSVKEENGAILQDCLDRNGRTYTMRYRLNKHNSSQRFFCVVAGQLIPQST